MICFFCSIYYYKTSEFFILVLNSSNSLGKSDGWDYISANYNKLILFIIILSKFIVYLERVLDKKSKGNTFVSSSAKYSNVCM
jgi:hypothetical protein